MLIKLVIEDISTINSLTNEEIIAIENLVTAYREGKHIIIGDRPVLERLKNLNVFHERTRHLLDRIFSEVTQVGNLSNILPVVVKAVSGLIHGEKTQLSNQTVIKLPLTFFTDTESIQSTILLAENLSDTKIYKKMAQVFQHHAGINSIHMNFESRGGGGSTTVTQYSTLKSTQKRLCLCVVDSDKKAPEGINGQTAQDIINANSSPQPYVEAIITIYREIENLLPTRLLSEISSQNPARMDAVLTLEAIEKNQQIANIRNFLDFKDGTSLRHILNINNNTVERAFWDPLIPSLAATLKWQNQQCINDRKCYHTPCSCLILPSFGPNILDSTIDHIQHLRGQKILEYLCSYTRSEWLRIGGIVFSWVCSGQRLSA